VLRVTQEEHDKALHSSCNVKSVQELVVSMLTCDAYEPRSQVQRDSANSSQIVDFECCHMADGCYDSVLLLLVLLLVDLKQSDAVVVDYTYTHMVLARKRDHCLLNIVC
jgi:hypothetical protein